MNRYELALQVLARLEPELAEKYPDLYPEIIEGEFREQTYLPAPPANLRTIIQETGPFPAASVILGVCEDGLPFMLDLLDHSSGSLLVAGDRRTGKTTLLKTMLASAAYINNPQEVRFRDHFQPGTRIATPGKPAALHLYLRFTGEVSLRFDYGTIRNHRATPQRTKSRSGDPSGDRQPGIPGDNPDGLQPVRPPALADPQWSEIAGMADRDRQFRPDYEYRPAHHRGFQDQAARRDEFDGCTQKIDRQSYELNNQSKRYANLRGEHPWRFDAVLSTSSLN